MTQKRSEVSVVKFGPEVNSCELKRANQEKEAGSIVSVDSEEFKKLVLNQLQREKTEV